MGRIANNSADRCARCDEHVTHVVAYRTPNGRAVLRSCTKHAEQLTAEHGDKVTVTKLTILGATR